MNRTAKILIISVAVAAILIAAIATAAFAAPMVRGRVPTPTTADYQAWGCGVVSGNYTVVADLLNLTQEQITSQLSEGKSLVEIAAAQGIGEDQLVQTILAQMKEIMGQWVTNGNWTQAQLDARLKLAEQHIRQVVNTQGQTAGFGGYGMMNGTPGTFGGYCGGFQGPANGQPDDDDTPSGQYGRGYGMMGGRGGMMGRWNNSY